MRARDAVLNQAIATVAGILGEALLRLPFPNPGDPVRCTGFKKSYSMKIR
jgi:hypothetical protein